MEITPTSFKSKTLADVSELVEQIIRKNEEAKSISR
jgi:hypothetical protein